jgi:Icc-related predicted phosphoesterase
MRRVIFYNIPENITEEKLKNIINENLRFTIDTELIQSILKIPGKNDKEHWIMSMPRSYAIELTKDKFIQYGFQRIYLKKIYQHIQMHKMQSSKQTYDETVQFQKLLFELL